MHVRQELLDQIEALRAKLIRCLNDYSSTEFDDTLAELQQLLQHKKGRVR